MHAVLGSQSSATTSTVVVNPFTHLFHFSEGNAAGSSRGIAPAGKNGSVFSLAIVALIALIACFARPAFAGNCAAATWGTVGVAFDSGVMTGSGGTAPYTFSVVGTLPAGLTLSTSTGEVAGTPTATGTFSVQSTDYYGVVGTTPCSVTIATLMPGWNALGISIAYNLVSLTGDISDQADITGRIAAHGQVSQATTIGTDLRISDPYMSLAAQNGGPYAIVAAGGIPTSNSFNVNAGGNVYSATATSAGFNFANETYVGSPYAGSTLLTGATSPIDFSTLASTISTLSGELTGLTANGVVCSVDNSGAMTAGNGCPANPVYFNPNSQHYNPSWMVLYGTSPTLNVFNISQAQFQSSNTNLDIEVPTGSTVIINVDGTNDTLLTAVYYQGNTVTDANAGLFLFNFASATSVTINGQFDGTLLAPYALLSGNSQMGGVFVAASIGSTGEVHYVPFSGLLPYSTTTPAPPLSVTCAPVNTGTAGIAFDSGLLTVTGGTPPYTYSIMGTLPSGLTLNTSSGEITGTPTSSGTFSVKVTDAGGTTGTACPISISSILSVSCAAITTGEVGIPFASGAMTVTGGTAPYAYSIVGTLPAGLTLNPSTGEITGTPTSAGTFAVRVTDASGLSSTSCNITISGPLSITCAAVTTGEVGMAFDSGPIAVTGGATPYSYSIVGTLPAGLSLNTSTGAVTGTPTTSGTFSVKVTDATGASSTSCNITINGLLAVTCSAINTGEVGLPFDSGPMSVAGGTAPYSYSIVGVLPAGLNLNTSTGEITGTPTAAGTFAVRVTDADGAASTSCNVTINGLLSITCAAVNTGDVGIPFASGPMTVTGGTAPYAYSIVGVLPAGLTLNTATGEIAGTATSAGTFAVKVTDADGASSTSCNITINGPLSVTCSAINTGDVGVPFNSGPMTVTGGTAPYSYSIVGTLPAGLTLNASTGAVAGTPTSSGTFTVRVKDAVGNTSTSCMITINGPLSVTCAAVATGEVGVAFNSGAMAVSGGTAPYAYSIAGTLPAGLTLNTTTGAVTGTPSASGTFSVKVTDANGASSTACAITINSALSVTCAAVTTGEVGVAFNSGAMAVSGGTAPYTYSIVGTLPAGLTLNTATGAVTGTPTAAGTFSVKVTDANGASSTACAITITASVAVGPDDAATIGYWNNNNGQALIDKLNGTSSAPNLAYWLSSNFPYLYGANSSNNLTGKVNTDVAALFATYFGASGQKTDAQVMAGALAVYVTNYNLAGSSVASGYGFNVSTTGTGAKTYNAGTDGTGAGLSNNMSYTVLQLLQQANLQTQLGTFNATAFNNIFSGINQTGDIKGNSPLSVTCAATTTGQVGVTFNSGAITVTGGTAPYTFSIVGNLPAGLTLNPSTGAITGTPTATGYFSVQVTDAGGSSDVACPISIGTGYVLRVSPSSVTVVAGKSATAMFTFTPFGGYAGTVSFSCSGLPAGAICTFVPASLTANGSNAVQTSTLTITTTASGTTSIAENNAPTRPTLASIFFLPAVLLGGFIAWRRRSLTTRMRTMLCLALVGLALVGGATGCSQISISNTPIGSQVVTVVAHTTVSSSASSGSDSTETANFTLTIIQ